MLVDVDTHFVVEQLSQVWAVIVQVWPSGQAGQVGTESHDLQRLKREREGEKPSMGEKEEGSTGLRSMMGEEDVGLAEAEQRYQQRRPVNGRQMNVQRKS